MQLPNVEAMHPADLDELQKNLILALGLVTHAISARRARLAGFIEDALKHEKSVDFYYRDLPEKWRW